MITKEEVLRLVKQGKTNELVKLGSIVVDILIESLNSNIDTKHSITALVEIAKTDENTFQRLIKELENNTSWKSRRYIAQSLGLLKDKRAVKALVTRLEDENENFLVRESCAESLGKIRDPKAVDPLIELLKIHMGDLMESCTEALAEIAKTNRNTFRRITTELLNSDSENVKKACVMALDLINDLRAVDYLIKGLKDKDSDASPSIIHLLAKIARKDDSTFQKLIKELLTNNLQSVRFCCAVALKCVGDRIVEKNIEKRLFELSKKNSYTKGEFAKIKLEIYKIYFEITGHKSFLRVMNEYLSIIRDKTSKKEFAKTKLELYRAHVTIVGSEKTLETIKGYLELIKNDYSKEELDKIKLNLYSFYRMVFECESAIRGKMDLPKLEMRPPKRGPIIHAQLRVAT
ncbi:MAG: HEAT repeat domain-containing protein [Candidatus Micrarchaeia archaeon]